MSGSYTNFLEIKVLFCFDPHSLWHCDTQTYMYITSINFALIGWLWSLLVKTITKGEFLSDLNCVL